jgi:predicted Zn-ribbon and HTH transcriptional regulator
MAKVKLDGFRCDKCGHEWLARDKTRKPIICPKCKSAYWNTPRREAR